MKISTLSLGSAVPSANSAKTGTTAPIAPITPAPAGIIEISSQAKQGPLSGLRSPLSNAIWGSGPGHNR